MILPRHWGCIGPFPPGEYWLVEAVRPEGGRMFWNDVLDDKGQSGWSFSASNGAGFATREEAEAAWALRGATASHLEGVTIEFCLHVWEAAN